MCIRTKQENQENPVDLDSMSQESINRYAAGKAAETNFNELADEIRRGGPELVEEALSGGEDGPWSTYRFGTNLNTVTIVNIPTGVHVTATGPGGPYTREIIWGPTDASIQRFLIDAAKAEARTRGEEFEGTWQLTSAGLDEVINELHYCWPCDRDQLETRVHWVHSGQHVARVYLESGYLSIHVPDERRAVMSTHGIFSPEFCTNVEANLTGLDRVDYLLTRLPWSKSFTETGAGGWRRVGPWVQSVDWAAEWTCPVQKAS